MSDNQRGAFYMMAAMLAFLVNDAIMKSLAGSIPPMQAVAMRSAIGLAIMTPILLRRGMKVRGFSRRDRNLLLFRSASEALSSALYISALFLIPLAGATAILQAMPLTITLAGAVFLGEKVGWRRFSAILIGFGGVMLILRPGPEGVQIGALLAVAAVIAATAREVTTRAFSKDVPSPTVTFYALIGSFSLTSLSYFVTDWQEVEIWVIIKLVATTVMLVTGSYLGVLAVRTGELAAVNPFRYSSLVFALLIGLIVFHETPEPLTLLGAAIVAGTGLFTLWRERQVRTEVNG